MKLHNRFMHITAVIMLCAACFTHAGLVSSKPVDELSKQEYDDVVQEAMRYFAEKQRANQEKRPKEASASKPSSQPDTNYLLEFLKNSPAAIK